MRRTLCTYILLMISTLLLAIPAIRRPFTLTQPDGTTLTVMLRGDEHFHYYVNMSGQPLVLMADGMYREATMFEVKNMYARWEAKQRETNNRRLRRSARHRAKGDYTGEKRGLVILVNFSDKAMSANGTQSAFNDMFNKKGYSKNGHIGSVRDYFYEQSYGQLSIDFDVVGPYTVSNKMSYYGGNDSEGNDKHPAEMVIEALRLADADVDYRSYDWDSDGEVEQVYLIYAGYGEAMGGAENTIWPHEWDLVSAEEYSDGTGAVYLDGVMLNTYACGSELLGGSGSTLNTIGTPVHEFSHCLGLPDLYDTSEEGDNFGLDTWSVMCAGSYNGPDEWGEVPAAYTSYERMFAGWLTPVELDAPRIVSEMQPLSSASEAYIIYNDARKDEYYLLENRQTEKFDSYLYGHGLLVLHVDYDEDAWYENTVNNEANHQRCTIIPADNQFMTGKYMGLRYATKSDLAGDPYPGTSANHELTTTSTPAATLYNRNLSGTKLLDCPLTEINEQGNTIGFVVMGGIKIDTPELTDETDVTNTSFTANWDAVAAADSYTLELRSVSGNSLVIADCLILSDDFSGFDSFSRDGTNDIGQRLDSYMQFEGWTGTKCFASVSKLKMGSASTSGVLTSPLIENVASSGVTIAFSEQEFNKTSGGDIVVELLNSSGKTVQSVTEKSGGTAHVVSFDNVTAPLYIRITAVKRIYLTAIAFYDGVFTAAQIESGEAENAEITTYTTTFTHYTFTGLDPSLSYSYRVNATAGEACSKWTSWQHVTLAGLTASSADVNGDGQVNSQDVLQVYEYMQQHTTSVTSAAEDVNADGQVDVQDVLCIYATMQES